MQRYIVSLVLASLAVALASSADANRLPFWGTAPPAVPTPTPTPFFTPGVNVIPVAVDGMSPAPDCGQQCDGVFFQQVRVNTEIMATPSPFPCLPTSTSGCYAFKYVDVAKLTCNTTVSSDAWTHMQSNEPDALHAYNHPIQAAYRYALGSSSCGDGKITYMNLGNAGYNSFLQGEWADTDQKYFPTLPKLPMKTGIWEDTAMTLGDSAVGGSPTTSEYGCGSPSGFANIVGCSAAFNAGFSWETAQANFINAAYPIPVSMNGFGPVTLDIDACSVISNGHCHSPFFADSIDDSLDLSVLCASLTGNNFWYMFLERPLLHMQTPPNTPGNYANSHTVIVELNAIASLYYSHQSDNCSKLKFVDGEYPYKTINNIASGYQIRNLMLAFRMMWANPLDGMPDRVIAGHSPLGGLDVVNEIPLFADDLWIPVNPRVRVTPFVWNGTTQSDGANCGNEGDSGGVVTITVECVNGAPVIINQYNDCYYPVSGVLTDFGKCAVIINMTGSTVNLTSGLFKHDAITSYNYVWSPSGGELPGPVNMPGTGSVTINNCGSANCTGTIDVPSQTSAFAHDGSDTLCSPCGELVLNNN